VEVCLIGGVVGHAEDPCTLFWQNPAAHEDRDNVLPHRIDKKLEPRRHVVSHRTAVCHNVPQDGNVVPISFWRGRFKATNALLPHGFKEYRDVSLKVSLWHTIEILFKSTEEILRANDEVPAGHLAPVQVPERVNEVAVMVHRKLAFVKLQPQKLEITHAHPRDDAQCRIVCRLAVDASAAKCQNDEIIARCDAAVDLDHSIGVCGIETLIRDAHKWHFALVQVGMEDLKNVLLFIRQAGFVDKNNTAWNCRMIPAVTCRGPANLGFVNLFP